MEFVEIQRKLIDVLRQIDLMDSFEGRSRLLQGLPNPNLTRSAGNVYLDLSLIIDGLHRLGRLTRNGGARPLMIVIDNALHYVSPTGEVADELHLLKQELERYYGGESPAPRSEVEESELEALLFGPLYDSRLPFTFIEAAIRTARSVARLTVPRYLGGRADGKFMYGTGWLIAPGLLITNHHVIEARSENESAASAADFQTQAEQVVIHFDYHVERVPPSYVECRGATLLASDRRLDYAIIELTEQDKLVERTPLRIISERPTLAQGARLNIVQHSGGGPLQYAIRNNFYLQQTPGSPFIHYQTDTERGASGSPVCDDQWSVVALHHATVPSAVRKVRIDVAADSEATINKVNEATLLHRIIERLPDALSQRILDAQSRL